MPLLETIEIQREGEMPSMESNRSQSLDARLHIIIHLPSDRHIYQNAKLTPSAA